MLLNWKIKIYYIKYIGSSNGLYYSHFWPCERIGASIAVVAPTSARGRSQINEPWGGASSSFDGAAVTNKLNPRCASRGHLKSAYWGTTKELLSGAPAIANHNDGDTAVANKLILHGVVTDNECVLCAATPAPLAFHGCGPLILR